MSANPRVVLADVYVKWGVPSQPPLFTRHGTVADIPLGSALEVAYGGPSNLSGIVPVAQRGDGTCWSKAALAN